MFKKSTAPSAGGYTLSKSLRFRSSASAYLNRTFSTPTSSTIWTWSSWIKRGGLTGTYRLFGASTTTFLTFNSSDQLNLTINNVSAATSTAVFRDPASWYHVVYQQNGSAQTIYVNNVSVATGTTAAAIFNTAIAHQIGAANTTNYFDGYMANVQFIDGQALTPTSFGATDATTGAWQPIAYTGSYGTNGFYLPFTDATSTSTLGNDSSGNSNTWTTNNISVTAGVTYDSMTDVPTLTSATAANYAVGNPLSVGANTALTNGNLAGTLTGAGGWSGTICGLTSGKWYYEATITATTINSMWIGFLSDAYTKNDNAWSFSTQTALYANDARNGNNVLYGASYTTNDVIGVAIDLSTSSGSITFYKNNVSQGVMFSSLTTSAIWRPLISGGGTGSTIAMNFGQQGFTYTPPSGYVALNPYNL